MPATSHNQTVEVLPNAHNTDRREAAIQAAYLDLIHATTPAQRRMHQEIMVALIRGRAPEVMAELERQRMERAAK